MLIFFHHMDFDSSCFKTIVLLLLLFRWGALIIFWNFSVNKLNDLQTNHMYFTLKWHGNDRFRVVSTWNTRGVFVGLTLLNINENVTCCYKVTCCLLINSNIFLASLISVADWLRSGAFIVDFVSIIDLHALITLNIQNTFCSDYGLVF